jgi:hypothetical protein
MRYSNTRILEYDEGEGAGWEGPRIRATIIVFAALVVGGSGGGGGGEGGRAKLCYYIFQVCYAPLFVM